SLSEKTGALDRIDQQQRAKRDAGYESSDRHLFAHRAQRHAAQSRGGGRLQSAALARDERGDRINKTTLLRGRRMESRGFSGARGRRAQSSAARHAAAATR